MSFNTYAVLIKLSCNCHLSLVGSWHTASKMVDTEVAITPMTRRIFLQKKCPSLILVKLLNPL